MTPLRPLPLALLLAVAAGGRAGGADIPRGREVLRIDVIPGKMGAVRFTHADHARKHRRPDGTPIGCGDCHHSVRRDLPLPPGKEVRCTSCHVAIGQVPRVMEGRTAPPLAVLKPDGAIDHRSILFHAYCRACHEKVRDAGRMLVGCKVCHERGVGSDVIHGSYREPAK